MSSKYEFIDAQYAAGKSDTSTNAPAITAMCKWLGVSKSGFFEWRSRPASVASRRCELLKAKIKATFDAHDGSYGYRRVHAALIRAGEQVGRELVRRLMRALGLVACQPRGPGVPALAET